MVPQYQWYKENYEKLRKVIQMHANTRHPCEIIYKLNGINDLRELLFNQGKNFQLRKTSQETL